jgi:outer membrane protein TolC
MKRWPGLGDLEGLVNFLSVLDAKRSLFPAEDQFIQSKATILTGLVSLYKALGDDREARIVSVALVAQESNANRLRTHDN